MHRDDRFGPRRNRLGEASRIDVSRIRVGIHQNRFGASGNNRGAGGNERVRRDNHFVPGSYLQRAKHQLERRGARRHPECVADAAEIAEPPLEFTHVGSGNERRPLDDRRDCRVDLRFQLLVLLSQRNQPNRHCRS